MADRTLPGTVHVHPFDFTVTTDRTELLEADLANHTDLLGHMDPRHLRILLDERVAPDVIAETLVHELIHALTMITGLCDELGTDTDETIALRLAPPLLAALRDNPALVAYLTGR